MTRPASALPPASYAHCWAGTWSALLTGWRGLGQVGLAPPGSHPLGNNNPCHGVISTPKVSGLPWREHALVRRRTCYRLPLGLLSLELASQLNIGPTCHLLNTGFEFPFQ